MKGKICDKCGKLYSETERTEKYITITETDPNKKTYGKTHRFDLCPDCEKRLREFIMAVDDYE